MQKGIIKEVREVAKEGKQTFYAAKLQDGTEMSTFDPKIKQAGPGDGLEFEVTVSAKGDKTYVNLKDGFTITKSSSSVSPVKGNGYPDMSKDDWAEKQRVERESIEAQTAVKTILSLVGAFETEADSPFRKIVSKALDWCEARIDATMKEPVKPPGKAPAEEKPAAITSEMQTVDGRQFKNVGEFLAACAKPRPDGFGLNRTEVLAKLMVTDAKSIADPNEAWNELCELDLFGTEGQTGKQEEVKSEEDIPI